MGTERVQTWLKEINSIGASDNGVNRLAYTKEESKAIALFSSWCEKEGMTVSEDSAGNVIARRNGTEDLASVAIGSHLDTVYSGGCFDGTIGVLAGLEIVSRLNERKIQTKHPVDIIVFRSEESSRFGVSTIGSKWMAGEGSSSMGSLTDRDGIRLEDAVKEAGLSFSRFPKAEKKVQDFKAFLEMHIEQGPALEDENRSIAIACSIAAPLRVRATITGKASHSGTTSMDTRKDALTGASELILALEKAARKEKEHGTVATAGSIKTHPGAMNVVPGECVIDIDIRSSDVRSRKKVLRSIQHKAKKIEQTRKLFVRFESLSEEDPVPLSDVIKKKFEAACRELDISPLKIVSGAGHDVMNMAKKWPSGLIFVPSVNGLSHHPDEYTRKADITLGVDVLEHTVLSLAEGTLSPGQKGGVNYEAAPS
ncbi:Zn-dependent hydrolase [Alteribacillus sp. HJP-4]|uniref:Zn-dependent hydrolase n=1 Tax=Alteribacillus sp. HJP-4 TaxID=2775394 RepID=UPI0035CD1C8C